MKYSFTRYQMPAILWAILIFFSSSIPSQNLPKIAFLVSDKVIHFLIFFIFCALTHRAIKFQDWIPVLSRHNLFFSVVLTVMYGVIDETHQYFVPGRDASLKDLLANFLGAMLYVGMAWVWTRRKRASGVTK